MRRDDSDAARYALDETIRETRGRDETRNARTIRDENEMSWTRPDENVLRDEKDETRYGIRERERERDENEKNDKER